MLIVVALQVLARLLAGPSLGVDDAEQALFAQAWSPNYRLSHPPLYTWLVLALDRTVGLGLPTFALLRASVLAAGWLLLYRLALDVLPDTRLAALAAASYALIYKLIYEAQAELAHALLGGTLIAAALVAFAALARKPTTGRYLLFGAMLGCGLLAKWNSAMFIVALLAGALLRPDLRPRVLDRRMGFSLLVMAILIAPSAGWVLIHWEPQPVARMVYATAPAASFGFAQMAASLGELAVSVLAFPQPFLVIFLALFATRLLPRPIFSGALDARLLASVAGLALIPFALMVPLLGVTSFPERWMLVALLALPIALFGFLPPAKLQAWRVRAFLGLAALAVVAALGVRIGGGQLWTGQCAECRTLIDFPGLANALRERGFTHGTIVVAPDQFHLGGNLRLQFPDSRMLEPHSPIGIFPAAAGDGQCLLVRRANSPEPRRLHESLRLFAVQDLEVPGAAAWQIGRIRVPIAGSDGRHYVVDFDLLSPGAGTCR